MKIKRVSPTQPLHPSYVTECIVCHCVWHCHFFHPINLSIVKQVKGFSNNTFIFWRELMSNWTPALEDLVLWISPTFQFYFSCKFRFFFSPRFSFFFFLRFSRNSAKEIQVLHCTCFSRLLFCFGFFFGETVASCT